MIYVVCDSEKSTQWFLETLEHKTKITWISGHKLTDWPCGFNYRGFCIQNDNTLGQIGKNFDFIYKNLKKAVKEKDIVILIK